jgi:hypothetical protein
MSESNTIVTPITQRVMARVAGAEIALVNVELRSTTAEFLARTLLWRSRVEITAIAGEDTYAIVPPQADAGTHVTQVLAAWYGTRRLGVGPVTGRTPDATGGPVLLDMSDPLTVKLWPAVPTEGELHGIVVDVAWSIDPSSLTPDSLTLPYAVLGYLEALTDGTLHRLFAMPDKPWSSTKHSTFHLQRFRKSMLSARRMADTGRGRENTAAPTWRFPPFA